MEILIAFRADDNGLTNWNYVVNGHAAITDLIDTAGNSTGLTLNITDLYSALSIGAGGVAGTEDAAWVPALANEQAMMVDIPATLVIGGLTNGDLYTIEVYGIASTGTRDLDVSIDGGTVQSLDIINNLTRTLSFADQSTIDTDLDIRLAQGPANDGKAFIAAMRIVSVNASPEATLDDSALEPGKAITGTYANFTSAPTVLTLTDSEGNTVSSASEINDLVIDDGAETYAFTMPDRITTGTGTTLLRGDITVELT